MPNFVCHFTKILLVLSKKPDYDYSMTATYLHFYYIEKNRILTYDTD